MSTKEMIKSLVESMTLDDPDNNKKIIMQIAKMGKEALPTLKDLIPKEEQRFRKVKMIEALGMIGDLETAQWVMDCTKKEIDDYLLATWIKVAGKICGTNSIIELRNISKRTNDPRVLANLIEIIGGSGDIMQITFLKNFVYHNDNRVRGNALMGIIRIADTLKGEMVAQLSHLATSGNESESMTAEYILRQLNIKHPHSTVQNSGLMWNATTTHSI